MRILERFWRPRPKDSITAATVYADVGGDLDRLPKLRRMVPRLPMSELPIDDEVAQSIREGKKRRGEVRYDITVCFNLSEALIGLAEEGTVTIWYTPQPHTPSAVVDTTQSFDVVKTYTDGTEDVNYFYNDEANAERIILGTHEMPNVRIMPEEVRELAEMISDCKKIVEESTPYGTTLEELNNRSLHPVDIFSFFANRRGFILPQKVT